jgi:hypothetical protein
MATNRQQSRAGRNNGGDENKNSRSAWWARGHVIRNDDSHRGQNEGLSSREIAALDAENRGHIFHRRTAITGRARNARRR